MKINEVTTKQDFYDDDPALFTLKEYLQNRNKGGKWHPSTAYNYTLDTMNPDYGREYHNSHGNRYYDKFYIKDDNIVFIKDGNPVSFIHDDTLYYSLGFNPKIFPMTIGRDHYNINSKDIRIAPKSSKKVKYITDFLPLVNNKAKENFEEHPVIINRIKVKGEYFEIRTKKSPYVKNSGATIAIINSNGMVAAFASDEWNTTLITAAEEYHGYGFGQVLGKLWLRLNPVYKSGGFTDRGKANAVKLWGTRVREALANGWYSDLIKKGEISKEKVQEIIADLPERSGKSNLALSVPDKERKPDILIYFDDTQFVIYDKEFYTDMSEDFIYAHGFLEENSSGDLYPYSINYDNKFRSAAIKSIFSLADDGTLLIKSPPADIIDFDGIDFLDYEGDYATLKDKLPVKTFSAVEKKYRKEHDRYDEYYHNLLELAHSKWSDR